MQLLKHLGYLNNWHHIIAQAYDIILELTDTFEAIQSLTVTLVARDSRGPESVFSLASQSQSVFQKDGKISLAKVCFFLEGTTLRLYRDDV